MTGSIHRIQAYYVKMDSFYKDVLINLSSCESESTKNHVESQTRKIVNMVQVLRGHLLEPAAFCLELIISRTVKILSESLREMKIFALFVTFALACNKKPPVTTTQATTTTEATTTEEIENLQVELEGELSGDDQIFE